MLVDVKFPARIVVIFFFMLFCTGWPYVRLMKLDSISTEITLSYALSISLIILVTEVLVFSNEWSEKTVTVVAAGIAIVGVALQPFGRRRQEEDQTNE